ncbi:MAG: DUF3024 domain-containing protein [Nevskiales bacterium]
MSFTDIELARHKRTLDAWIEKNRPPPHIRPKLDFGYRITGQSVELFEIRPAFGRPEEMQEGAIAKATWNKRQGVWKVYWQRADLKWHAYEPARAAGTLDNFLKTVREDKYACFFG